MQMENGNVKIPTNENKMEMEEYKKNENVKIENRMKKFPNRFNHQIAQYAPPLVCATEALQTSR